jgi:hypothetical protein
MLVSCLASSSTLKTEAICSFEASIDIHHTTRRYVLEDTTLHSHRCGRLKSKECYWIMFQTKGGNNNRY